MESRKVQGVGSATLAVSLPSKWVKEMGVRKGDLVYFIFERDGSLRLVPSTITEHKEQAWESTIYANLCDEPKLLERIIVGNYILGRDMIRIVSPRRLSPSHIEEVRRIVRKLSGLSIIEETPNEILLQCSIDPTKFPIHIMIRRLYIIASTMFREAIEAYVGLDCDLAKQAISREEEADTLYWLIIRLLISAQQDRNVAEKMGLEDLLPILGYRAIAQHLERMADWGENIAKSVLSIIELKNEVNKQLNERISKFGRLADEVCYNAIQSLFVGDLKLTNRAISQYKEVIESEEERLVNELPQFISDARICSHLRNILFGIKRVAELGAEIGEIAINRILEKTTEFCEMKRVEKSHLITE